MVGLVGVGDEQAFLVFLGEAVALGLRNRKSLLKVF